MAEPTGKPHEYAHYSAGRWLLSQAYVVGWPSIGVVKSGSTMTGRPRYGAFLSRGAQMLHLAAYPFGGDLDIESRVHAEMDARWPRAFDRREDAAPYLGAKGGGYLECYMVPLAEWGHLIELVKGVSVENPDNQARVLQVR